MDAELYIDLLKRCVANAIYADDLDMYGGKWVRDPVNGKFRSAVPVKRNPANKHDPVNWPTRAHTMIGPCRLDNLRDCVETVLRGKIPGDLIETAEQVELTVTLTNPRPLLGKGKEFTIQVKPNKGAVAIVTRTLPNELKGIMDPR